MMSLNQSQSLPGFDAGVSPYARSGCRMMRQVDAVGDKSGLSEQAVPVQRSLPYVNRVFNFVFLSQPLFQLPGVVFMGPVRRACAFLHGFMLRLSDCVGIGCISESEAVNGF